MQHSFTVGAPQLGDEVVYRNWHHHWLFGLVRPKLQKQLDIDDLCPAGNASIHEEVSFANGVVDILTAFIYSPTTVTVTCGAGDAAVAATAELSGDEVREIAEDPRFREAVERLAPERLGEFDAALAGLEEKR